MSLVYTSLTLSGQLRGTGNGQAVYYKERIGSYKMVSYLSSATQPNEYNWPLKYKELDDQGIHNTFSNMHLFVAFCILAGILLLIALALMLTAKYLA